MEPKKNNPLIEQMLKLAEVADVLTKKQAKELVDFLVSLTNEQKKQMVSEFNTLADTVSVETTRKINEAIAVVSEKHADALLEVRQLTNKQKNAHEAKMSELEGVIQDIKAIEIRDGIDGQNADEEKIIEEVLKKIPTPKEIKLDDGQEIVVKINEITSTKDEFKIDAKHIKNLKEYSKGIVMGANRNLYQLLDVNIPGIADGNTIVYSAATQSWIPGTGSGSLTLQTNSTPNASQTLLNLIAGTNITLTDNGVGGVTFDATVSGSQDLQSVTDIGNTTTNDIFANRFITPGGAEMSDDGTIFAPAEYIFRGNTEVAYKGRLLPHTSVVTGDDFNWSFPAKSGIVTLSVNGNTADSAGNINVSSTNIYNTDGTLTGSRNLDIAGNNLNFRDSSTADKVGLYFDSVAISSSLGSPHASGLTNITVSNDTNKVYVEAGTFNVASLETGGAAKMVTVNSVGDFGSATIPSAGGTVTSVTSANSDATVANTTTTPVITIVSAPKWTTGRTLAITGDMTWTSPSFDGSGNVTAAGTLATVNSNVGTFTNATVTVNGKGLITAASSGAAPEVPLSFTSPLIRTTNTISIQDAAADGTTKGASTFTAADFNATAGLISIDYTNGQAASASNKGFLTSTDWTTFNNKGSGTVTSVSGTTNRITSTGGTTPVLDISSSYVGQSSITTIGTLGAGAVPASLITSGTFGTGSYVISGGSFGLSGNQSAPTWTTSGIRYRNQAGILTDTTAATGTTALAYTNVFGGSTIAATNTGVIFTNYFNTFFNQPVAGTNVTFTNAWALGADNIKIGTSNQFTISNAGVATFAVAPTFSTMTAGSILFVGTSGLLSQDNANFQWDGTNHTFGIGASASTTNKVTFADTALAGSGSLAGSILNMTQTWNTSGSPTAIKLNVTNTASGSTAKLMDLQIGGATQFYVDKSGNVVAANSITANGSFISNTLSVQNTSLPLDIRGGSAIGSAGISSVRINPTQSFTNTSGSAAGFQIFGTFTPTSGTATYDMLNLTPTINQTGGANGITRGLYINPTITSAADWRPIETTKGTIFFGDTYASGSGSLAGSLLNLTQTWNTSGAPTAIKLNVTNTSSGAASLLMDLQVGGVSKFSVSKSGAVVIAAGSATAATAPLKLTLGTAMSTAETGALEYSTIASASQLTFTRTGTTRETILMGNTGASAPATNNVGILVDYFGVSATRVLSTPNTWISIVASDGATYKLPAYS